MNKDKTLPWMREGFWETHFWKKALVCMMLGATLCVGLILTTALVPFFQTDIWIMNISGCTVLEFLALPLYLEKKRPGKKDGTGSLMGIVMLVLNALCFFAACILLGLVIGLVSALLSGTAADPDMIDLHP